MSASQLLGNPFISQTPVPPEKFVGRESLLHQLYSRLIGGNNVILTGALGSGKSKLLAISRYARWRAALSSDLALATWQ